MFRVVITKTPLPNGYAVYRIYPGTAITGRMMFSAATKATCKTVGGPGEPICFSPHLYRARNLVERFFNKIKRCRRIATRYEQARSELLGLRSARINTAVAPR